MLAAHSKTNRWNNGIRSYTIGDFTEPHWIRADKIKPKKSNHDGDYLVLPRLKGARSETQMDISGFTNVHGKSIMIGQNRCVDLKLILDKELAWVLGIFVAEGFTIASYRRNKKQIIELQFSLNRNEIDIRHRLAKYFTNLGYHTGIRTYDSAAIALRVYASLIARAFATWCGSGASHKRIPNFVLFHSDKEILEGFLDGYIAGDGHHAVHSAHSYGKYPMVRSSTVSKTLILQLQLMYARLGIVTSLRKVSDEGEEIILGRRVHTHTKYSLNYYPNSKGNFNCRVFDNHILMPVRKVETVDYEGPICNITTTSGTYLVSNAVTHNCGTYVLGGGCVVTDEVKDIVEKAEAIAKAHNLKLKWFASGRFHEINATPVEGVKYGRGFYKLALTIPKNIEDKIQTIRFLGEYSKRKYTSEKLDDVI